MRRLILFTLALWVTLVAAVVIAVGVGHQQPASKRLTQLHLNDCELPCWIGIVPGKTTLEDAQKHITGIYGQSYDVAYDVFDSQSTYRQVYVNITEKGDVKEENTMSFEFFVKADDSHIIQFIEFYFPHSSLPTTAEIFGALGSPTQFKLSDIANDPRVNADPQILFFNYGGNNYSVLTGISPGLTTSILWNTPIRFIDISPIPYQPETQCVVNQLRPWRGFRSPQLYLDGIGEC